MLQGIESPLFEKTNNFCALTLKSLWPEFLIVVFLKMGFCLLIFRLTDEETRKIWEESGDPDGPGGKICVELLPLTKGFGNGKRGGG